VDPGPVRVELRSKLGEVAEEVTARPGEVTLVTLAIGESRGASRLGVTRWSLAIGGGALLVAGAVLALEARSQASDLEGSIRRDPNSGLPTTQYSSVSGFESSGHAFSTASWISLSAGAAALAASAVLFYFYPDKKPAAHSRANGLVLWF
jgi:hypothetical protein